jgi:hypothetical protein
MQCPKCQSQVSFRDVADERCPTCASKIYWADEWRWLRGLSCGLLAILMISHWFPRKADLGEFVLWLVGWCLVSCALLSGSFFTLPPKVDLVPGQGPIRLDLQNGFGPEDAG